MSSFELADCGAGRFELRGDMSFSTAEKILRLSEKLFAKKLSIEVNLAGVQRTDSAGLALLLEWTGWSQRSGAEIRFTEIPQKVLSIAETAELEELLLSNYSSSSKK